MSTAPANTAPPHTTAQPSTAAPSTKPPVTFPPSTHLDPSAYVRGTYPVTLGENVIVYPRAHLLCLHAPLIIEENSLISSKAVIGGPLPDQNPPSEDARPGSSTPPRPTIIGPNAHIHASCMISHSVTIGSTCIIESHAVIQPGISIGVHVKICAGVTVSRDVPDWTVVYGNGNQRRTRRDEGEIDQVRMRLMGKERDAVRDLLRRTVAEKAGLGARKR